MWCGDVRWCSIHIEQSYDTADRNYDKGKGESGNGGRVVKEEEKYVDG